ncbi:MAG: serine hydrolase [Bacteroidota bacterium]
MRKVNILIPSILITIIMVISACTKETEYDPRFPANEFVKEGIYNGKYWPTDAWKTCTPEEVGMDSEKLKQLNEEITILLKLHADIHSVLIVKNGYIVAEQYYSDEFNEDSIHRINSCTKSITSALMGIAINKGIISDVNQKMIDFFPEYEVDNLTTDKQNITLEHMLTMSTGLEWYEMEYGYGDERNSYYQWVRSEDRVKYVLDLPMVSIPSEEYSYNTGVSHLLSAIIQKESGMRTDSFAMKNLFKPLGINEFYWFIEPNGIPTGGHGLRLSPRDMAKFGYLYLNNGIWDGTQVVPENWVIESSKPIIQRKYIQDFYYGYQWWVSPDGYYCAVGYAGQWIYVVPDSDLVVVFTNSVNESDYLQLSTPERLLRTYILPAFN